MVQLLSQLTDIPDKRYQGYVWYSDASYPVALFGDPLPDWPEDGDKRFVVEALLYDPVEEQSYHILHVGHLIIQAFDFQKLPEEVKVEECTYLPYRLDSRVKKIRFARVWQPEKDPYCDNAVVLRPVSWVFRGFEITQQ